MILPTNPQQILEEFLSFPLNTTDDIFSKFENLPGAVSGKGNTPLQRYVCIPGTRANKIVLVAHADTVWDAAYKNPKETTVLFNDGLFTGENPTCGIGGDDRAGCAMLWALKDSGHTLLLTSGEEKGKLGAKFLRKSNPRLFRELNRHCFMIALDWQGTGTCLYNQVDYTDTFYTYITNTLNFQKASNKGGCDLQILCHRICGVNIGTGYHNQHSAKEYVDLSEWENTLTCLAAFLEKTHPRFPISIPKRICSLAKRSVSKLFRIVKIKKPLK